MSGAEVIEDADGDTSLQNNDRTNAEGTGPIGRCKAKGVALEKPGYKRKVEAFSRIN